MKKDIFIIDADAHVRDTDAMYRERLTGPFENRQAIYPSQGWDRWQGGQRGVYPRDAREQLQHCDAEGIDIQVLYPTSALNIGLVRELDYQAALCRVYNDWLAEYRGVDRSRFKAMAVIPVGDPPAACRELDRAVSELGAVGVMFPTYVYRGRSVADPFFWPIYEEAERLGVPVAMHANGSETSDIARFDTFLGVHAWSHVPEQMITVTTMVLGGVVERFQRLRIGFMESGCGWLPFWMEHLEGEWEKRRRDAPLLKGTPTESMKSGRCYYACEPEERTIPYVASWIGEDQLLYASDYPHWDCEWPNTASTLLDRDDLSEPFKKKLLSENVRSFYNL
ncbi:MAG: amidohydrolase family protein [Chloroflexota bacterium]